MYTCSQLLREWPVFSSAPDRRDFITKLIRELNSEMTQATDTLHRNQIAGKGATVTQRVVGGNASAQQGRGVDIT